MLYRLLLCLIVVNLSGLIIAQPETTFWSKGSLNSQLSFVQKQLQTCEKPEFTVTVGDTINISFANPDSLSPKFASNQNLNHGSASFLQDTLFQYRANPSTDETNTDSIFVELCDSAQNCSITAIEVKIGRKGASEKISTTLRPEENVFLQSIYPKEGDLHCREISNIGFYAGADRRAIYYVYVDRSDTIAYRGSRFPGLDSFKTIVCNDFGTCDTTYFGVTIPATTLSLPFCDDFSKGSPLPNPINWLENDVWINNSLAQNPPSLGVATFDGIKDNGTPYGSGRGETDILTSTYIDLTSASSDIFLKYFIQRGGNGQSPENGDFLTVEGKDKDGIWKQIASHEGNITGTADSIFKRYVWPLTSDIFKHDKFQIRFKALGNQEGAFDNWNLDYVRVEEGNGQQEIKDIALMTPPSSILTNYTGLPYSQFSNRPDLITKSLPINIYNHFKNANNVNGAKVKVTSSTGVNFLDASILKGSQFNLPSGVSSFINDIPSSPLSQLQTALSTANQQDLENLTISYELGVDQEQEQIACVLQNDTASTTVHIKDYFSYDDGTAESGIRNGKVGEQLVIEYEAVKQDTLRGLQFKFPRLADAKASGQLINLVVYIGSLSDSPSYKQNLVKPFFTSGESSIDNDGYTTYALEDDLGNPLDLIIPAGKFYIGWQQASSVTNPVPVGIDLNNDQSDKIFSEYGAGWVPLADVLPSLKGSLMIRALFSDETPNNTSPTSEKLKQSFRVFPNPSNGVFNIYFDLDLDVSNYNYQVLDVTGRTIQAGSLTSSLNINQPSGVYIMNIIDSAGKHVLNKKLVLQ